MKASDFIRIFIDPQCGRRSKFCVLLQASILVCFIYLIGSVLLASNITEKLLFGRVAYRDAIPYIKMKTCKTESKPHESKALPEGIITRTTNFELRPLWGSPKKKNESSLIYLFAAAVGINQKSLVNKMVRKFLSSDFAIILFHYDGNVDKWKSLDWSDKAIHVSAMNQTKWWFAKRFLHPDIVAEYSYIFLWDEDLGVENFHPKRYISIVQREGLEISQPALDRYQSKEIHHQITARGRRSDVHRRVYKSGGRGKSCNDDSKGPPCTGWIEMMAPVFSRAAWRCVWYMIQNDLIHAWGLDMQLGYCAQGDRLVNVGVVDAEYIVHFGHPTLGGTREKIISKNGTSIMSLKPPPRSRSYDHRSRVRKQSATEFETFKNRWEKAVQEDKCWIDPFL